MDVPMGLPSVARLSEWRRRLSIPLFPRARSLATEGGLGGVEQRSWFRMSSTNDFDVVSRLLSQVESLKNRVKVLSSTLVLNDMEAIYVICWCLWSNLTRQWNTQKILNLPYVLAQMDFVICYHVADALLLMSYDYAWESSNSHFGPSKLVCNN